LPDPAKPAKRTGDIRKFNSGKTTFVSFTLRTLGESSLLLYIKSFRLFIFILSPTYIYGITRVNERNVVYVKGAGYGGKKLEISGSGFGGTGGMVGAEGRGGGIGMEEKV
jgi:hypothetical protein